MSGAASLSAAKRRRGGSASTTNQNVVSSSSSNTNQTQRTRMTPVQMLRQHDLRIESLEKAILKPGGSDEASSETQQQISGDKIDNLTKRLDLVESRFSVPKLEQHKTSIDNEKFSTMQQEISELKQIIFKLQTFAIETNTSLMKYKNDNQNSVQDSHVVETPAEVETSAEVETPAVVVVETPEEVPDKKTLGIHSETQDETFLSESFDKGQGHGTWD